VLCFSSFPGGDLDQEVVGPLAEVGVPFLEGTETAMLAIRNAREHRRFLDRPAEASVPALRPIAWRSAEIPRGVLSRVEAMRLLSEFEIPLVETRPAAAADDAVRAATAIGYPVALKIDSPDIAHKSDVGGVRLGCGDAAAVRQSFRELVDEVGSRAPGARLDGVLVQPMIAGGVEMIAGLKSDPLFGPAVVCGFGGIFAELFRDVSIRIPPLTRAGALRMIGQLRGAALLRGARGRPPTDVPALAETLIRLAQLADTHRLRVRALDLNPLIALDEGRGVVAVDGLVEFA
jgi:acyl-CoA synthetase (NDP forming)